MSTGEVPRTLAAVVANLPGGGEPREGQQEMATAVAKAIESGRHLVVRAGTGTGKSFAYLIPAALSGRRVVIATATKALQDQLAEKDLPSVLACIERDVSFAVLKGRSNYLCRQRLAELQVGGEQARFGEAREHERARAEQLETVLQWAKTTQSGDRAELGIEVEERIWSSLSVTPDECPGAFRCPSGGNCFAEAARAQAAEADVLVVNQHLLGAHLAAGDAVLPEFDALVVDEAHEWEEVLSRCLGFSLSPGRLRAIAAIARNAVSERPSPPTSSALDALFEAASRLEDVLAPLSGQRIQPGVSEVLDAAIGTTGAVLADLERALGAESDAATDATAKRARAALTVGRMREQALGLLEIDEERVAWVESRPRTSLEVAPLDVGEFLSERVFGAVPVVLTSATVPPSLAVRLGADPERTDELEVGSPFAFQEQALLYCATHLPDRRSAGAEEAIHDELAALIEAAGGRTLALFTSFAAMDRAVAALRGRVGVRLLAQGQESKNALVEAFRSEPETCLFATMGFWQGIDVPGSTLSLVTIDRLPFGRPDDPLLVARRAHAGRDAFSLIDLPRAASLLAQGAGRLIRTSTDRGVVAVLDPRLATASYRWALVRALPPMRRTKDRAEVERFLRDLRECSGNAARS